MRLCTECRHARWIDTTDGTERIHQPFKCMGLMVNPVTGKELSRGSLCREVNTDGHCGQWVSRSAWTNEGKIETESIKYIKDEE